MKNYILYLLYDMIPGLFRGIVRFCSETFTVIKLHFLQILGILAALYLFDIYGTRRTVNNFFYSVQHWFH